MMETTGLALTYLALSLGAIALGAGWFWCVEKLLGRLVYHLRLQAIWWRFVFWHLRKGEHPDLAEHLAARKKAEEAVKEAGHLVAAAHAAMRDAGLLEGEGLPLWNRVLFEAWLRDNSTVATKKS